jgi:hypothetical protein
LSESPSAVEERESALASAARFVRDAWLRLAGVSALVLIPCFWHREIVAADLGSHLYNAWLAQLIERGQVKGLWLARQWSNVLFDYLLSGLAQVFSWHGTEVAAVSIAVLIFFWGMFALASAASRRAPWTLTPLLAIFTYGWTFHMGFFNYCLSLGLSFFAIAIVWRGRGAERLVALALAPVIYLAHPLGLLWMVGASAYVLLAQAIRPRLQILALAAGGAVLAGLHAYLWLHYVVEASPFRFYEMNGSDQVLLFGDRYKWIARALITFALLALALDAWRSRRDPGRWEEPGIVLQIFLLALLAVPLLPRGVHLSESVAAVALLTDRLTSVTAALGCCLLATMRPAKWHLAATMAIAAVFFAFVYQDTAVVNAMEAQAVRLVRTLPPNSRVLATILPPDDSRITIQHMIDRACIGRCFSYGNYEPGSRLFRVRASGYNSYVLDDYDLAVDMEEGDYTVRDEDLPIWQVYQCDETCTRLCLHSLEEGEDNDRVGIHPDN